MGYIRLLLALAVAIGHLQSWLFNAPDSTIVTVGPVVAVKLFFIISGFYMALIFKNYANARAFFANRALRLYPIYWTTILLTLLCPWLLGTSVALPFVDLRFALTVTDLWPLVLYWVSNLTLLGLDTGLFFCQKFSATAVSLSVAHNGACYGSDLLIDSSIVRPAWTLSLELYFYLLVPLLALARARLTILLALASFVLSAGIWILHNENPWYRSFFPAELHLFLLGMLACRFGGRIPEPTARLLALVAVVAILSYQHISIFDWSNPNGANVLIYSVFAVALPSLFKLGSKLPFERFVGDLSYPIYISHALTESVIYTLNLHSRWSLSLIEWIAFNMVTVLAVATMLWLSTLPLEIIRDALKTRWKDHAVIT